VLIDVEHSTKSAFKPAFDRYSMRATCYVKAPYSEIYYFNVVNETTVIVNGKTIINNGEQ
jgi:hypothetical protein